MGGVAKGGKRGRGSANSIVVIAVEMKDSKGFGRVRMRHIPDASGASLQQFVRDVVAQGATVHTDGWTATRVCEIMQSARENPYFPASGNPSMSLCLASSRGQSSQALDSRHSSRRHSSDPPSVLPGGVYFQVNRRTSRSRGLVFGFLSSRP